MLNLSDDSNKPHNDSGQPNDDSSLPAWDDLPDTQIVEITPDGAPALPESEEQNIINDILNGTTGVFRLPAVNKPDHALN